MTKYAYFDNTVADPKPVLGWYDTDRADYDLPAPANLLELGLGQDSYPYEGTWAISAGIIVAYVSPGLPLTLNQQADIALNQHLTAGIVVSSTGTPAIDGTYALDATSTAQIFQIGLFAAQFGFFPSGDTTQFYPDISGIPHSFSVALFIDFLHAVAPYVSAINTQVGIMRAGGTPVWPSNVAAPLP